jgi:hypothetical protein
LSFSDNMGFAYACWIVFPVSPLADQLALPYMADLGDVPRFVLGVLRDGTLLSLVSWASHPSSYDCRNQQHTLRISLEVDLNLHQAMHA